MKKKITLKQYSVELLREILSVNNKIESFELSGEQHYFVYAVIIDASIWFEYYILNYQILKDSKDSEKNGEWYLGYACGALVKNDKQIDSILKDLIIIDNKVHYMLEEDNIDLSSSPIDIDEIGFYLYKAAIERISELILEEYINNYQAKEVILYYYKDILKKVIKKYFLLNEKYIIE